MRRINDEALLTVTEVAHRFRIDQRTLRRLTDEGKLEPERTLMGQLRFREPEVADVLAREEAEVAAEQEYLAARDARIDRLETFAQWLIDMDTPVGARERQMVTLTRIIDRARAAMYGEDRT